MEAPLMRGCTIQCMGWDTYQIHEPELVAEHLCIAIYIYHREHTNNFTRECHGHVNSILATHEVLLDDNQAYSYLTSHLSTMGISTDAQLEIIRNGILKYRTTNIGEVTDLRTRERDLPILIFRIVVDTWMLYNEQDAAAWATEESMEADVCKPIPAAKSAIDALEEEVLIDCSDSTEQCVICLEKLDLGIQVLRRLPCSHIFHGDCIVEWLETSHLCPLCRFEMPTERCLCSKDD